MKKMLIFMFMILIAVVASAADSTSTSIKISDVQYFSMQSPENDLLKANDQAALKPFALIQPTDKWFSKDKWMHFTTAYFLTLQSSFTLEKMFYTSKDNSRNVSVGIALGLSLGKEFYDVYEKKSIFSWKDLCYDVLGASLGYYTTQLISQ